MPIPLCVCKISSGTVDANDQSFPTLCPIDRDPVNYRSVPL